MSAGGFLRRWSAHKRVGEDQPRPADPAAADLAPPGIPPEPEAEAEAMSEEEIAALTPVAEMTAGTDLAQYLRKGVPAALQRAALRRMWTLNPAIRDYLDVARDYAWDWNTPGGVPGSGVLGAAGEALRATAVRMLSGSPGLSEPLAFAPDPAAPEPRPPSASAAAPTQASAAPARVTQGAAVAGAAAETAATDPPVAAAAPQAGAREGEPDPAPRRHGGARPVPTDAS